MSLDTTSHDIYRGTSGITLPKQLAAEVWAKAQEESAVMRLAQRITLPGSGVAIPVITGDPAAAWTNEAAEKAVSNSTFQTKNMVPYKIAVIELFSNEFRRDLPAVYAELVKRLPAAIGKKFDETVFLGSAPGTGFDVLSSAPTVDLQAAGKSVYEQLVAAYSTVGANDADLNGWAISPAGEAILLGATDSVDRPLFIQTIAEGEVGTMLGAPVVKSRRVYKQGAVNDIVGIAGDWTQARWGMVEDIKIDISEEATINDGSAQINLWQRNMFAVRVEAEVGFVCTDDDNFVQLLAAPTGATS